MILTSPLLVATTLCPGALRRKPPHPRPTKTAPQTAVPPTKSLASDPATSSAADASFCCHTSPAEQIDRRGGGRARPAHRGRALRRRAATPRRGRGGAP